MYKGNRWYKCDFHLHTTESLCFSNKRVTPEEFVDEVVKKELDCIAITDHNCARGIDEIRDLASQKGITVFPGVEITCSDSKIHLLILFDLKCTKEKIEDFLISIKIDRDDFGTQDAHSQLSIAMVAKKASENNVVIIPAHIDDYAGITHVANSKRKEFLELTNIKAVQMVKKELILTDIKDMSNSEFKSNLINSYNDVEENNIKDYIACTRSVREMGKGIMTFSDNPNSENDSKHGLWGIGSQYTWIKMDESPTLESLRQALLMPDKRIKNFLESPFNPYIEPDFWIKKICISNLETIKEAVEIDFSPQLNTIIGGRGSGKSTIIRLLTGVFGESSIKSLEEILSEFKNFFQIKNDKTLGRGVLKKDTEILLYVRRNSIDYKIIANNFTNISHTTIVEKFNSITNTYEIVNYTSFKDLFEINIYNQKQIYEMAKNTNILRDNIDSSIQDIYDINKRKEELRSQYIKKYLSLQESKRRLLYKNKLIMEMKDINEKIDIYNKSDMRNIIAEYRYFNNEHNILKSYLNAINTEFSNFKQHFNKIKIDMPQLDDSRDEFKIELTSFINDIDLDVKGTLSKIEILLEYSQNYKQVFNSKIRDTEWYKNYLHTTDLYKENLNQLESNGVNIDLINSLVENLNQKKLQLDELEKIEKKIPSYEDELRDLKQKLIEVNNEIRNLRNSYINNLLHNTKIKFELLHFRDKVDFEFKLRNILQKESKFDEDFANISKNVYSGLVEKTLSELIQDFYNIKEDKKTKGIYSTKFKNIIKQLNDEQFANLDILLPEDELRISYQPHGSKVYKPLSNASAGQKTSAILTFILTEGNIPLILDQPEDDLDNKLIYELIVERLKETKEKRQLIIATHNANIPVNGDSELVIAMNSSSNKVKVNMIGTLDDKELKQEICDVMEGGTTAFKLRSEKYGIS